MATTIGLRTLEQPILDQRPYLHFNELNAQIFQMLVPDAEKVTIRTNHRGASFKMPTTLEPGRSLCTIRPNCLSGYLDRNPWAGYVWLEASDDQFAQIQALCEHERYYGTDTYFCKQGTWWHFGYLQGARLVGIDPLPSTHNLYHIHPPTGWHQQAITVIGDETYWLAVHGNYGTETKRAANRSISTLKISPNAFRTLDFLFHGQISDYATTRSTYHYITFNESNVLDHKDANFFYFQVTGRELKQLETITRKMLEDRSYVWMRSAWYMLPGAMGSYAGTLGGEYPYRKADPSYAPTFIPPGASAQNLVGSTDNRLILRGNHITVTYSEKIPGQPGWWWIKGDRENDTKDIRLELRRFGCQWSKRRVAWYYEGRTLPAGLQKLLGLPENPAANPQAPQFPTASPFRPNPLDLDQPTPTAAPSAAEHRAFQSVFNPLAPLFGHRIVRKERLADGQIRITGTNRLQATRRTWVTIHDTPALMWEFTPSPDQHVEQNVALKNAHATYLTVGRYWLFDTEPFLTQMEELAKTVEFDPPPAPADKPDALEEDPAANPPAPPFSMPEQPSSTEPKPALSIVERIAQAIYVESDPPATPSLSAPEPETPSVPLIPDALEADPPPPSMTLFTAKELMDSSPNADLLQQAIKGAAHIPPTLPVPPAPRLLKAQPVAIPQTYVGELTGAVAGDVHCYGYAIDKGICIWVNMGGPRMAVEAIRAKFSRGDIVNLTPWDAPAIELTAGEGHSSQYADIFSNMSQRKFCSLMLLHKALAEPLYGGKFTTYVLSANDADASKKVFEHLTKLVAIPIFPEWRDTLWHAGNSAMFIRRIPSGGGLSAHALELDSDDWTRLIAGSVENGNITLPRTHDSSIAQAS